MTRWSRPAHVEERADLSLDEETALRADDRCRRYPQAEYLSQRDREWLRFQFWRLRQLSQAEQRKDFPDA